MFPVRGRKAVRPTRIVDWRGKTAQALMVGQNLALHSLIYDAKTPSEKGIKAKRGRK